MAQIGMTRPKHQHWVPQFYLRYFSTPETKEKKEAQVWVFSKDETDGDERLTNIRNVCGKRYLYTSLDEAGERVWSLETKLDRLESLMGTIWPELAEGFIDLGDEPIRKGLALFIAVMHLRNPEVRSFITKLHQQIVKACEAMPMHPDGRPAVSSFEMGGVTYAINLDDWHEYKAWGKNDHDKFFAHIVEREAIHFAELLMKKRWSIVFAERDVFITSDKPVAVQHLTRMVVGFGTEDTVITFPLTQKRVLVMDDRHQEPANQYYPFEKSNGGAFNYSIWRNGSRFMITGRTVPDVLSEILECGEAYEHAAI